MLVEVPDSIAGAELERLTQEWLERLNPTDALTVVYMAAAWEDRVYFYRTVVGMSQELPQPPRIAGSLGLRMGELQMLSQLDQAMEAKLDETLGSITAFFDQTPEGKLVIRTTDDWGTVHELCVPFNTIEGWAPYVAGAGRLSKPGEHLQIMVGYGQFTYDNIPGGEVYLAGYPFKQVEGSVATIHGLTLKVHEGLLSDITGELKPAYTRHEALVQSCRRGGRPPLAELGLACMKLIGVQVNPVECSILGLEKYIHHVAFGVNVSPTCEQEAIVRANEGNPHHIDVMM